MRLPKLVDRVVYVASPAVTSVVDAPALNSRSLSRVVETLPLFIPWPVPIAVDCPSTGSDLSTPEYSWT